MDLQTLAAMQQKTSSLTRERQDVAADLCDAGLTCLIEARDGGFQNRELLALACGHLLDAIRHHRGVPEPYIGMGYILWLIGDYDEALPYLDEALALVPEHPDALLLLDHVRNPPQAPAMTAGGPDYDLLYDQVEAAIMAEVKLVSNLSPQTFAVTHDPQLLEKMERRFSALSKTEQDLLARLTLVEQEIDCEPLRNRLRTLESFLLRTKQALAHSRERIQLQEKLAAHSKWIEREFAQIQATTRLTPAFSQAAFEALLDDCDRLADQLDLWEHKGQNVADLVACYERLTVRVAELQDWLDLLL